MLELSFTGFGFIKMDNSDGPDVFVHQSEVLTDNDGYRMLEENSRVQFEVRKEPDGRDKAYNVTGVGGKALQSVWGDEKPLTGKVIRWREDRGFGFVAPLTGGGEACFTSVHNYLIKHTILIET